MGHAVQKPQAFLSTRQLSVKLAAARSLSTQEIISAYNSSHPAFPCIDDGFLVGYDPETIGEAEYWGSWPSWIEGVVIGTMKEEGSFLSTRLRLRLFVCDSIWLSSHAVGSDLPAQSFLTEVADAYGIEGSETSQEVAFYALQKFVGDGFFVCHTADTAREAARRGRKVYYQAFDQFDEDQPVLPWLTAGKVGIPCLRCAVPLLCAFHPI